MNKWQVLLVKEVKHLFRDTKTIVQTVVVPTFITPLLIGAIFWYVGSIATEEPKKTYVEKCLKDSEGPILAASDYMRISSDQIRPYTNKSFYSLGTDGYGRSDTRKNLRNFFEVDKKYIVTYALSVLSKEQLIASKYAEEAIKKYNIDKNKPMPTKL